MANQTQEQVVIETLALKIAQLEVDNAFLKAQIKQINTEQED